jgi:hypothetical protein
MAESLEKRWGRTKAAIDLLASGALNPLVRGQTPYTPGSEEEAGYIAQRLTIYKDTLRIILRTDSSVQVYHVGKRAFSVHTDHGNIYVPVGVVSQVGLSLFPYKTTLIIYGVHGQILKQYDWAGNRLIG